MAFSEVHPSFPESFRDKKEDESTIFIKYSGWEASPTVLFEGLSSEVFWCEVDVKEGSCIVFTAKPCNTTNREVKINCSNFFTTQM